jgi:integrase
MGLGPVDLVSLAEAREKARECRKQLLDGIDPIKERRMKRQGVLATQAKGITFKECAEAYIGAHEKSWKNAKHRQQWANTLITYAYPVFGQLNVAAVDTGLVLKAVEPIWQTKTETASRLRGRVERVLDWAATRGYRKGENPARWKGHLANLLPARRAIQKVRHHPAMPWKDVPAFMAALRANGSLSAKALQLTILTALRTSEAIGGRWDEFDLEAGLWSIPASRMKAAKKAKTPKPHVVPLSRQAVALLAKLPRLDDGDFLFPGVRNGRTLSDMAMLELLRGMRPGLSVHGFRSSFRDWVGDATDHPAELAEKALAHTVGDAVERAYRRGDALEKRRKLMQDWADFCASSKA